MRSADSSACCWGVIMANEAISPHEKPKPVLLDGIERLEVAQSDYFNEIVSLRTLIMGLRQLYGMVKSKEIAFDRAGGDKVKVFAFGFASEAEREFLEMVACFFHWYGLSICNYARLTGFIRGLARGDFDRSDLHDASKFKRIKAVIDEYVSSIPELESVVVWRNKVFAHFAITDPFKDDNIATLDMSVIFPVSFDGRYVVGGLTMTRSNPAGSHTSELPRWSITEVFESLEPRFWHGLKFREPEKPPEPEKIG